MYMYRQRRMYYIWMHVFTRAVQKHPKCALMQNTYMRVSSGDSILSAALPSCTRYSALVHMRLALTVQVLHKETHSRPDNRVESRNGLKC